ncbi:hypothetical protein LTR53_009054 [Teratosphaeriaceae sp. CCFEE 6253]|nr:hypothetical protein LTR53_009054 [Teratosphaeriaceae sp. CCFEE 6253]
MAGTKRPSCQQGQSPSNWRNGPVPRPVNSSVQSLTGQAPINHPVAAAACTKPGFPSTHHQTARKLKLSDAKVGLIVWLPDFQSLPPTSAVRDNSQPWMKSGAGSHPALIAGLSDGGRVAHCHRSPASGAVVWTPGLRPRAREGWNFPIGHPGQVYNLNDTRPALHLASGRMTKQSYINTRGQFTIETTELEMRFGNTCLAVHAMAKLHKVVPTRVGATKAIVTRPQPVAPAAAPLKPLIAAAATFSPGVAVAVLSWASVAAKAPSPPTPARNANNKRPACNTWANGARSHLAVAVPA